MLRGFIANFGYNFFGYFGIAGDKCQKVFFGDFMENCFQNDDFLIAFPY